MIRLKHLLFTLLLASCTNASPPPQVNRSVVIQSRCEPLFGSDDVIVAPNNPSGLPDSGLIVIAKWDGHQWKSCGVTQ